MPPEGRPKAQRLNEEELAAALEAKIASAAVIGTGVALTVVLLGLTLLLGRGIAPSRTPQPLILGAIGLLLMLLVDVLLIAPTTSSGATFLLLALPFALTMYGCKEAAVRCATNDLIRVSFRRWF